MGFFKMDRNSRGIPSFAWVSSCVQLFLDVNCFPMFDEWMDTGL
jgi:hypothetical protein